MFSAVKLWKSSSISGPSWTAKSCAPENRFNARQRPGHRMQPPDRLAAPGQRHVEAVGGQCRLQAASLEADSPRFYGVEHGIPGPVDCLTGSRALIGWQDAEILEQGRDLALLAQKLDTHIVEASKVAGAGHCRLGPVQQPFECVHRIPDESRLRRRDRSRSAITAGNRQSIRPRAGP